MRSLYHSVLRQFPYVRRLEESLRAVSAEREHIEQQRNTLVAERDELLQHVSRIEPLEARNLQLQQERIAVLAQRDVLEAERDQLKDLLERLELSREALWREAQGFLQQLQEVEPKLEQAWATRDAMAAERDELKRHAERQRRELQEAWTQAEAARGQVRFLEARTWAEPGHFYSPIVNPTDPHVRAILARQAQPDPQQWEHPLLDDHVLYAVFQQLAEQYPACPFTQHGAAGRYRNDNEPFTPTDAITLFGVLAQERPRRYIEVGCGYSTCALLDACDKLDLRPELRLIEPYPQLLRDLLPPHDAARKRIYEGTLQSAPLEWFAALEAGDILFIDSSHVLKMGSDVHDYLFRILPALQPGVLVHIHDIFYPFEYAAEWVTGQNRSWNEAYALHAFLAYNPAFEIVFWNDYFYKKYRALVEDAMPLCAQHPGGSIWLRKRSL